MDFLGFVAGIIVGLIVSVGVTLGALDNVEDCAARSRESYCSAFADSTERECRIIGTECQCANGDGWETVASWEGE